VTHRPFVVLDAQVGWASLGPGFGPPAQTEQEPAKVSTRTTNNHVQPITFSSHPNVQKLEDDITTSTKLNQCLRRNKVHIRRNRSRTKKLDNCNTEKEAAAKKLEAANRLLQQCNKKYKSDIEKAEERNQKCTNQLKQTNKSAALAARKLNNCNTEKEAAAKDLADATHQLQRNVDKCKKEVEQATKTAEDTCKINKQTVAQLRQRLTLYEEGDQQRQKEAEKQEEVVKKCKENYAAVIIKNLNITKEAFHTQQALDEAQEQIIRLENNLTTAKKSAAKQIQKLKQTFQQQETAIQKRIQEVTNKIEQEKKQAKSKQRKAENALADFTKDCKKTIENFEAHKIRYTEEYESLSNTHHEAMKEKDACELHNRQLIHKLDQQNTKNNREEEETSILNIFD
jgi:hypothetical protein